MLARRSPLGFCCLMSDPWTSNQTQCTQADYAMEKKKKSGKLFLYHTETCVHHPLAFNVRKPIWPDKARLLNLLRRCRKYCNIIVTSSHQYRVFFAGFQIHCQFEAKSKKGTLHFIVQEQIYLFDSLTKHLRVNTVSWYCMIPVIILTA